ncbi:unnamed protein product [Darwinula stevensoni]|uniref:peptidylprolyl isomerase n=1 Tax=Darwinula stevensoni TaxID=69355 RepID=A0A7R9A2Z9_9CRUS|nr:unnamed protein product [Darwinula stevensoni]CAG0880285.1 unnamed protein product [Darwinula stevensoni]
MSDVPVVEVNNNIGVLNTGSPHYVQFVTDLDKLDVKTEGQKIRYSDRFKAEGINVNFVERKGDRLHVRTYERGVEDETLACGTGVTACAIADWMLHDSNSKTADNQQISRDMIALGGSLSVHFTPTALGGFEDIWLAGPAVRVYDGKCGLFLLSNCKKNDTTAFDNQLKADVEIINNYLAAKGWTADSTDSGLRYRVTSQGSGNYPTANSVVKVRYKGYLTNGNVFDESTDGATFGLYQVIPGWTEGIQKFKEGDAHIKPIGLRAQGISKSEDTYIGREVMLKHYESRAWGTMIGPFGGCYAIRANLFEPIPPNFLVDDFLITFRALEQGYAAINDLSAQFSGGSTSPTTADNPREQPAPKEESAPIPATDQTKAYELDRYFPTIRKGEIVKHKHFALAYNEDHEQAEWVLYYLTRDRLNANWAPRPNSFRPDPTVRTGSATTQDYVGSGYDRGHLCPAGDMAFDEIGIDESFYMSNMSPQDPKFNIGIWRELEELTRDWARKYQKLYIVTGPVLTDKPLPYIGPSKVTVPKRYYRVLLAEDRAIAFIMPNENSNLPVMDFACSIDKVEEITQLDFFPQILTGNYEAYESKLDKSAWPINQQRMARRVEEYNEYYH